MAGSANAALSVRLANHQQEVPSSSGLSNVNSGAGSQKNSNQTGGFENRQYNAKVINFNDSISTRSDFTGLYSYTSLQPVATYVSRPARQDEIEEQLRQARTADTAHATILVLVGLGGSGKTQLALDYVQRHHKEYSAIFWIDARLRQSVERDYRQIYCLLSGVEYDAGLDIDRVRIAVKTWFYRRQGRWLFVFDNADGLDDDDDSPSYVDLQGYLPDAPCVDILITTQTRTGAELTWLEAIEVGQLAPAEALDVFVRCGKLRNPSLQAQEEIKKIVEELDYLARAVTAAGAYFAATPHIRSNIKAYLPEYRRWRKGLLGPKARQQIHRYGESVLTTWETSYAAIEKQCPVATRLLGLCTFLNSEDIFLELFRSERTDIEDGSWESFLSPDVPFAEVLHEALTALSRYCLLTWKEEQGSYSMHKLVRDWAFERLTPEEKLTHLWTSFDVLDAATSNLELDATDRNRVVPHILATFKRLHEWRDRAVEFSKESVESLRGLTDFLQDAQKCQADTETQSFVLAERDYYLAVSGAGAGRDSDHEEDLSFADRAKLHNRNERWRSTAAPEFNAGDHVPDPGEPSAESQATLLTTGLETLAPQWTTSGWLNETMEVVGFSPAIVRCDADTLDDFMSADANITLEPVELTMSARSTPFARGAVRAAFYARTSASTDRFVMKKPLRSDVSYAVVAEEMRIQALCTAFALEFNDFLQPEPPLEFIISSSCLENKLGASADGGEFLSLEPYLEGKYVKYNNNAGWVLEDLANDTSNRLAQAFSHFTFERSGGRLMAIDLQGVGRVLTDPAVHALNPDRFMLSDTNLGSQGFAFFFSTHECNNFCQDLRLTNGKDYGTERYRFRLSWPRVDTMVCCSNKLCRRILRSDAAHSFDDSYVWCATCWPQLESSKRKKTCAKLEGKRHEFEVSEFFYESQGWPMPHLCLAHRTNRGVRFNQSRGRE